MKALYFRLFVLVFAISHTISLAVSPIITIELKEQGSDITFELSANADDSEVPKDCGDGIPDAYSIGTQFMPRTGTAQASGIKIYGSSIEDFNIVDVPINNVLFAEGTGLKNIFIINCQVDSIYLKNNQLLNALKVVGGNLKTLNLDGNTMLTYLEFSRNSVTEIDLQPLKELLTLVANENLLSTIDLSHNNMLTYINLQYNNLQSIDVSNLVNLKSLFLYENKI